MRPEYDVFHEHVMQSCRTDHIVSFFNTRNGNRYEVAMFGGLPYPTDVCPPDLSVNGYLEQCRPFYSFDDISIEVCHAYLTNRTSYYLLDTAWLDQHPLSFIGLIRDIVSISMDAKCAANVMEMICHSWFRECREVDEPLTGRRVKVPSLLCRSECENHLSIWNECVTNIQNSGEGV
jgi:hypothetical protein